MYNVQYCTEHVHSTEYPLPEPGKARKSSLRSVGNATTTRTPQAAAGLCPTDRIRGAHEHEEEKVPFPVVPSSTVPSCSGAKRICSFQLRRYLVVWSCTLGSTAQPSRGIGRKKRGRANATAFCALSSGGAPERRRRERRFPSPLFPAFARRRQADGLILPVCATGGPTRRSPSI
jgi:hypothetical protein